MAATSSSGVLLDVRDLSVRFNTRDGVVQAVSNLSFTVRRGETLGVVGESGSGKSVTSLAIMGLLNPATAVITGEILFEGRDLLKLKPNELRHVRGRDVSMIFQDPFACLHPMYRVGDQIAEAVLAHEKVGKKQAWNRSVELLGAVGIPNAAIRAKDFPHQFSGGMRQRAMIAMALVHNPDVLIADEPTTALDVTVQAQIIELIDRVKREFDVGVILITHDLGVVAETASHVMVMYAGRVMEYGTAGEIFTDVAAPVHVGAARVDAVDREAPRHAAPDRGLASVDAQPAARLPLPPPVPVQVRALRLEEAAARPASRRPSRRLPALAGAQARDLEDPDRRRGRGARMTLRRIAREPVRQRPARRDHEPDQVVRGQAERLRERQGRRPRRRGRVADGEPGRDARHRR